MNNENKVLESRGNYTFNRIGRPVVMLDQRSKYNSDMAAFDATMADRKRISNGLFVKPLDVVSVITEE